VPLPRQKDDGSGGAPVLNLLKAHVRLFDVEEHTEPWTVTRKSDGREYVLDPQFSCSVKVIDDGADGSDNGVTFFESFKYKQDKNGEWFNKENSKLGQLTLIVKPGYFDDDSIPALTKEDLEDFEMICRIKPKKDPNTGRVTGSTIDWETMQAVPEASLRSPAGKLSAARERAKQPLDTVEIDEEDFEDIPF